jgi:hypothetical protein
LRNENVTIISAYEISSAHGRGFRAAGRGVAGRFIFQNHLEEPAPAADGSSFTLLKKED